jgi:TRAP-type C4-dicarboxylate transport system permease small subunit
MMFRKIANSVFAVLNILAVFTGIILVFAVVGQIASRYVPFINMPWSEEIARFSFIHFAMISIAMAYYKGRHMGIDIITKKCGKSVQAGIYCFYTVLVIVISIIVSIYGIRLSFLVSRQRSPMLNVSYFWFFIAVPIGFSFTAIFAICEMITKYKLKSNPLKREA